MGVQLGGLSVAMACRTVNSKAWPWPWLSGRTRCPWNGGASYEWGLAAELTPLKDLDTVAVGLGDV